MLSRPLPSIDHFLFTPKKYLPLLFSTTSLGTRGPVYSMIFLPLGMRLVANSPRPVAERLISKGFSVSFICEKISCRLSQNSYRQLTLIWLERAYCAINI